VADLTGDVNTVLRGRGEILEVSPEHIGWTLRALGLHADFLPGGRKGLILLNNVRKKMGEPPFAFLSRTPADRNTRGNALSRAASLWCARLCGALLLICGNQYRFLLAIEEREASVPILALSPVVREIHGSYPWAKGRALADDAPLPWFKPRS